MRHILVHTVVYTPPHPNIPHFLCPCVVHVPVCCVSVRSAAPDFHKLNEDGELWLVNQGLKETIRCYCVSNTSVILFFILFFVKGCLLLFCYQPFSQLAKSFLSRRPLYFIYFQLARFGKLDILLVGLSDSRILSTNQNVLQIWKLLSLPTSHTHYFILSGHKDTTFLCLMDLWPSTPALPR